MSGNSLGGSSSNSSASSNNKQQQPLPTSLSSQQIGLDPSTSNDSLLALHSSHKVTNLKAASLPPQNDSAANQKRLMALHHQQHLQHQQQTNHHQHRSTKSQEPSIKVAVPSNGKANYCQPFSMDGLFVTPPNIAMSQVKRHLSKHAQKDRQDAEKNKADEIPPPHSDDGGNDDHHNVEHFDQGAVFDTLARWQQELSSVSDKQSKEQQSANGHSHHINHHDTELDIEPEHHSSLPIVEPQLHHQNNQNHHHHQQHQATNARRFITRSTRSGSRQSAGHSSPPPPSGPTSTAGANYHHCSDSSDSSPSPTRRHNQLQQQQASIDQQSSANGNSSAYETAATSVMTHGPAATAALAPSIPVPSQQQQSSASIPLAPAAATTTTTTTNNTAEVVPKTVHPLDKLVALRPHPSPAPASSDKKKEEVRELRQRYTSPSSPRAIAVAAVTASNRRLSSSELSPKLNQSGFNSEPIASIATVRHQSRACSQPTETPPTQRRQNLVAVGSGLTMKQNLSELHFTGAAGGGTTAAANTSPKPLAECTLRMRPRSSTMCNDKNLPGGEDGGGSCGNISSKPNDNLTNIQLSPVERNIRTPEASPRRLGDRDKSSKRKSNLNRSLTEEATKDGDDLSNATNAAANRRRRRRELGQARPLLPADDDVLRDLLLQSPMKGSCSESTTTTNTSRSESQRAMSQLAATMRHPEVPVRTMTAVLPCPKSLHAGPFRGHKLNERTKTELAEIKKIAEMAAATTAATIQEKSPKSPILRRKSTDDQQMIAAPLGSLQTSPPAPNQIVSILKKKEHAFGECNSSNSSNASPVTFSSSVMDPPLATGRSKRQGILKKRSSLDESRYYSRSHSPDERSILIKSARRNSLEESGTGLQSTAGQGHGHGHGHGHGYGHSHGHGILKQSSYDSNKSDGCPSATECQPHSILKKKDSLSTPSDGGCHKHVSISQAVILAAAELAAHDGCLTSGGGGGGEDIDEHEIRPILKQESTSSEEAVRPPKPILKKKSFGEADEHEIRPILKSSRKSSREEFDLNLTLGHSQDNGDIQRPILKTESPSKRRSLGSNLHELDLETTSSSSSSSMLKRRTRSLERHDGGSPVMDLAAALDAIATSQTPVDFVTTPASMSVAERVKHMEMLSTTTTTTPISRSAGGINSIWDTPSSRIPNANESGVGPRLLKPSVLRRDLQRERYKTQPVTSEEKSFFKANSTPFDISATSAFKPTKPLDIRLTSTSAAQQPLISPITGQPLSHVPAPLLLSSSAHSAGAAAGAAGSGVAATSFRLARSSTQPLQSPRVVHLASQGQGQAGAGAGAGAGGNKPSAQSTLLRQHSINDSFSLSEQLTLSLGNDSENIFEMSGLDDDSAIQSLGDEAAQARATATSAAASATSAASTATTTTTTSLTNQSSTPTTTSGLTRSNSVRARANMFQQLQQQEQMRNRRDSHGGGGGSGEPQQQQQQRSTISNRQALRQSTPPPASNTQGSPTHDETSTPNTTHDAEFEPSSLSLAERLAFFSSLCDTGSGGGGSGGIGSCRTSSYSKSPPMDRTPRSSTTASSASVTPTPMEFSPMLQEDHHIQHYQPSSLTLESINEHNSQNSSNHFHVLSRSATEPTAVLCDQQRQPESPMLPVSSITKIKIRTVGKLIMPDTFMGDRNNNNNTTINNHNSNKTCLGRLQTLEEVKISMSVRTIGKIKSPFIEQQQQQQQPHSKLLTNGGSSSNQSDSDSGKENCASNEQKDKTTPQKVSEMRRKITRLVQQQQQPQAQPVQRRHTTEITTSSNTGSSSSSSNSNNNRSPLVDERYAKYFGCKESFKTPTVLKTESMPLPSTPATPSSQQQQQQQQQKPQAEATNEYVRLPTVSVGKRREILKRTRPMSFESSIYTPTNSAGNIVGGGSNSPTAMPSPKRAHSPGNRIKAMISCYDDIIVTPAELNAAGKEFHRLCKESLVG